MEIIEFAQLLPEQRVELEGAEHDPFDMAGCMLHFRPKERHVALRDDQGRLVASTGLVVVDVEVEGHRFPAVGLGGVIVNQQYRGRGLARRIVETALDRARTLGPAFAMLFCHEDRAGLYRKLGFEEIRAEVIVEQPGGYEPMPLGAMWRALEPGASWPEGNVSLRSLPF
jgi:GNAT superfamily N-acetyltransferase